MGDQLVEIHIHSSSQYLAIAFFEIMILGGVIYLRNYCGDNTMTLKEARAENALFFEFILAMI